MRDQFIYSNFTISKRIKSICTYLSKKTHCERKWTNWIWVKSYGLTSSSTDNMELRMNFSSSCLSLSYRHFLTWNVCTRADAQLLFAWRDYRTCSTYWELVVHGRPVTAKLLLLGTSHKCLSILPTERTIRPANASRTPDSSIAQISPSVK